MSSSLASNLQATPDGLQTKSGGGGGGRALFLIGARWTGLAVLGTAYQNSSSAWPHHLHRLAQMGKQTQLARILMSRTA